MKNKFKLQFNQIKVIKIYWKVYQEFHNKKVKNEFKLKPKAKKLTQIKVDLK